MNDCEKYMELMSQMLDGELSEDQTSELRTHIASCEQCRRVFDAFTSVSESLSDELAEPPEMLAKGVLFKLKNQKKRKLFYGRFTAIAACFALVLLGAVKFGFFAAGPSEISLDSAASESEAYSAAAPADESSGSAASLPKSGSRPSRSEIEKGVKLETADDGTVYQLGFPIQNVQLLEGTKPAEVKKEPVWLLNAKKLEVYRGSWYSDAELADDTEGRTARKNERIASVTDSETLDALDALLTADPDVTTTLTVDSKEFTDREPVCTLFIPAEKADETDTASPKAGESPAAGTASASDSKANSLRESLESVKNSLLNLDDAKASASPSPDPDGAIKKQTHDLAIGIYYVDGEIWCVAQIVNDNDADDTAAGVTAAPGRTEKTEPSGKPAETAQPSPSASPDASAKPDGGCLLPTDRILYRAVGKPDKLDDLLKQLENAKDVTITQNTVKK